MDALLDPSGENMEFNDLPEFANEFNKDLHAQIKEREKAYARMEADYEETKDRITVMSEHLKSVQQEQLHTQQLVDAKIKEIETEDHLKQLSERECGRYKAELDRLQNEHSDLQDKLNIVQNAMFQGNEKMDRFKLQMNWNQEELEQWALAARQKEEDNLALLKYTKADEGKTKELNLQIEKMTQAVQKKKAELDAEVTETQAAQIELDKTAEDFRLLHRERQELVSQWEAAIEAMQKRDEAIRKAHEEFNKAKVKLKEKQEQLMEKEAFLHTEQKNNAEVEMKISSGERNLVKQRQTLSMQSQNLADLGDQLEVMKNTLSKAALELASKRQENAHLGTALDDKKKRLEKSRRKLAAAEKELERSNDHTGHLEKSAKKVEEVHAEEEARHKNVERELSDLKDKMYKESQKLFQLRQDEANTMAEISGAQRTSKNASARIHKLDEESQRQKELIYNAEFQMQLLERKVARAQGERTDAEKKALTKRINELTVQLEEQTGQYNMLTTQVKRLEDDLRAAKRKKEEHTKTRGTLEADIAELELKNDTAARHLKNTVKNKEERMVAHDCLKLEVKRLREQLNSRADEVFGLENRKFQLKMSMEERGQEIQVHAEVLRAQHKAAEEERHQAAIQLKERLVKVERLKNKFEVICGRVPPGDDDMGKGEDEHSQAYYVIRAAQEREELQREGDELDQKIQKAEREIRALEKTLQHLYQKNSGYKQSFAPVDASAPMYEQKVLLEEQHRAALGKYRSHRLEQSELEEDLANMEASIKDLENEVMAINQRVGQLSEKSASMANELQGQMLKLERAAKQVTRLSNEHRKALHAAGDDVTPLEMEVKLSETKSRNKYMIEALTQMATEHQMLAPMLEQFMSEAGIKPPSRPTSRASSARSQRSDSDESRGGSDL